MALADLRQGYKNSAWFTSNPTLVLKQGQVVHLLQTGQYKLGDGTTQLSALSFLGSTPITGFVPYTGATSDVDLGVYNMNARSFSVTGVNGNGHIHLKHQSIDAGSTGSSTSLFADVNGNLAYKNDGNPYVRFISHTNTADRSYTLPNASGTIALTSDLSPYLLTSTAASTYQPLLGFTAENVANKAINFVTLNNTLYPTTQAVSNYVTGLGYITSAALSPYLLASTAASTYQPIGSYLTANQTITLSGVVTGSGSTAITTSFASTTGSGAVVLATSPTFLTDITTPIINGGTAASGNIQIQSTTNATKGAVLINTSTAPGGSLASMRIAKGTGLVDIGEYTAGRGAVWINQATPTSTNWSFSADTFNNTFLNGQISARLLVAGSVVFSVFSNLTTWTDAVNMSFGTVTGTRIGTATTQRIGFWNATPVVQPTSVTTVQGLYDAMASIGLIASGTISGGGASLISGTANVNFVNETVKEITINTTSVLTTSRILITFAMASTKDMDELDFYKPFVTYGKIVNGTSFNVRVCLDAPTTNNFKIDYQIIN